MSTEMYMKESGEKARSMERSFSIIQSKICLVFVKHFMLIVKNVVVMTSFATLSMMMVNGLDKKIFQ